VGGHEHAASCFCLAGTIVSFNFLGDGLRDWLDPRSRAA